jgi:beta-phosphoglucomutase-like phosphatase (HAD superfamily)
MPALVFDLDGTLVDSVYQHVAAWSDALRSEWILAPNWKIHRHVGMSGGSFLRKLLREIRPRRRNISIDRLETKTISISERASLELKFCPDLNSS